MQQEQVGLSRKNKQTNKQTDNMTTAKITKSEGRANMFHHWPMEKFVYCYNKVQAHNQT